MRLQAWHIIIIVLVIVILFGARRLPDLASSVGKSLKIFKKEVSELREDTDIYQPGGTSSGDVPPPATGGGHDESRGPSVGGASSPNSAPPGGSGSTN